MAGDSGSSRNGAALGQGDAIVVKITLDKEGHILDNLVIEDLLTAGLESGSGM